MGPAMPQPDQAAAATEGRTAQGPAARRQMTITITARSMWIAALIGVAILVVLFLIARAQGPLILLVLAIILGEAIRPLVSRLRRYRIPAALAVLLIYLVALAIVGGLAWLLLTPLLSQVSALVDHLPRYLIQLRDTLDRLERSLKATGAVSSVLDGLSASLAALLRNSIPTLLSVPFTVLTGLFSLFINLVIVLAMMLFWLTSSVRLKAFVVGLFPAQSQEHAALVISEVSKSFGGYVRGTLINMVIIGLLVGLGLTVLSVPYALLLGVLAGFTELLPYIGPWISGPIAVLVALITVDPAKALEVIALFFVVFVAEGEIVQPLVMSRTVRVDPLLVLVSVLIGIELLGIIGAILAVPIAAGIQVLVLRVLAPMLRRASAQTEPSPPTVAAPKSVSMPESPSP